MSKRAYETQASLLGQLGIAERISAEASAIVFATVNPQAADDMLEFIPKQAGVFRGQQTEVYHVSKTFDGNADFKGVQNLLTYYTTGPVAHQVAMTPKIPLNQFVTILKRDLCLRIIRSYKNNTADYTIYSLINDDGSTLFELPLGAPVVCRVGGMVSDPAKIGAIALADRTNTNGLFNALAGADVTLLQSFATNNVAVHGKYAAAKVQGDRTYTWWAAQETPIPASADWIVSMPAPSANQALANVAQSTFIFYWVTPPPPTSGKITINMYGRNEGQEYLCKNVSGSMSGANMVAGVSFASIVCPADDDYRFELLVDNTGGSDAGAQVGTFGIVAIKTGEDWSHLMTTEVDTQFGTIKQNNWIATSMLCMNGTNGQNVGGFQSGVQGDKDDEWQAYVDGQDPYQYITTIRRQKVMTVENGGYSFLRPMSAEDYKLVTEIDYAERNNPVTFGAAPNQGPTFYVPARDSPFYIHCVSAPTVSANQSQQVLTWRIDQTGEYSTDSQWRHPTLSKENAAAWDEAIKILVRIPQLYENPKHNAETMLHSLLTKSGISGSTADNVLRWGKVLFNVGKKAIPLILGAM
jgi:hypothetical protein